MELEEVRSRLSGLNTACIADADKRLRVMGPGLRPLQTGLKLVGAAHTVMCHNDFLTAFRALEEAQPGEVLVIETQGGRSAVAGELLVAEARRKRLAGVVIDGACRDTRKIATMNFPVYALSTTPVSGTARLVFDSQVPVECAGVRVTPGEIVFGDDDGLIVASEQQMSRLIPIAEEIQATEAVVLKRVEAGEPLHSLMNFDEHWDRVKSGRDSQLSFKL